MLCALLPSSEPFTQLGKDDEAILGAFHQVIRQQDLLQTRIRALEALNDLGQAGQPSSAEKQPLTEEQSKQLRAWLQAILDGPEEARASMAEHANLVTANEGPVVKLESEEHEDEEREPRKAEQFKVTAIKTEETDSLVKLEALEDVLPPPQAQQIPPAIVVPVRDGSLLSPPLSTASSSSSGLDTPTPSTNVPQSFDLFGSSNELASVQENRQETPALDSKDKASRSEHSADSDSRISETAEIPTFPNVLPHFTAPVADTTDSTEDTSTSQKSSLATEEEHKGRSLRLVPPNQVA